VGAGPLALLWLVGALHRLSSLFAAVSLPAAARMRWRAAPLLGRSKYRTAGLGLNFPANCEAA